MVATTSLLRAAHLMLAVWDAAGLTDLLQLDNALLARVRQPPLQRTSCPVPSASPASTFHLTPWSRSSARSCLPAFVFRCVDSGLRALTSLFLQTLSPLVGFGRNRPANPALGQEPVTRET
eukprot:570132-Rhodomonas_salina.1